MATHCTQSFLPLLEGDGYTLYTELPAWLNGILQWPGENNSFSAAYTVHRQPALEITVEEMKRGRGGKRGGGTIIRTGWVFYM